MSEENSGKSNGPKGPSHHAFAVREAREGKSHFKEIGAAFPHKDGKGFNIELEATPVNGRVVLRTPSERLKDTRDGGDKDSRPQSRERD